ncbi:diguanylate cyclase with PAS/PAC sensor [Parafrankia sp. EAN1pec]|uniref:sensor domain-containing protein n=1 Tax=Parafrankia sp. (strain EAN1pec) TaxID=298653 RepID=UPI0000542169|nr:diguanylate cyclase with PAS/PAC sensor [Frankia sp. EAN1pec]
MDFRESLVDELRIGVIITGAHSRIVRYVNATACQILGREPDEMLGRSWQTLVPQTDYELFTRYERRVIGQGPGGSDKRFPPFRMRFARPGGEIVHVWVTSTLAHNFVGLFGDDEPQLVSRLEDVADREQIASYLGLALDNSPMSVGLVDPFGRIVFATRGRSPQETEDTLNAEATSVFEVFADYQEPLSMVEAAFKGESDSLVVQAYGRYFDFHVVPITDAAGQVRLAAALATDVTERELARAGQAQLASLAEQALVTLEPVDLWQHATTVLANQLDAAATLHEIDVAVATAHGTKLTATATATAGPPVPSDVAENVLSTVIRTGRTTLRTADLTEGWRTLAAPIGRPGVCRAVVAVHRPGPDREPFGDRDEEFLVAVASVLGSAAARFAAEQEIRYRSTHDTLTDLPNRSWLLERLARSLKLHRTGVVFIDLDGFKTVNDTYGHQAGDRLLCEIARRLEAAVRPDDLVARLAGDEFAVLCERVDSPAAVERLARRVLAEIEEPVVLAEGTVRVSASAGVAISRADLSDPDRLLNASDIAMYAAKRAGAGQCIVHESWMHL